MNAASHRCFSEPQMGTTSCGMAKYAVTRMIDGVRQVFVPYFVRDASGVWRLGSM